MKITFEEVLSRKEWIHSELLNSLTGDIIDKAKKDGFYEVKLLVNGEELEPALFNQIMINIERFITEKAKSLIREKLEEAENKVSKLYKMVEEASNQIIDEFNLDA